EHLLRGHERDRQRRPHAAAAHAIRAIERDLHVASADAERLPQLGALDFSFEHEPGIAGEVHLHLVGVIAARERGRERHRNRESCRKPSGHATNVPRWSAVDASPSKIVDKLAKLLVRVIGESQRVEIPADGVTASTTIAPSSTSIVTTSPRPISPRKIISATGASMRRAMARRIGRAPSSGSYPPSARSASSAA